MSQISVNDISSLDGKSGPVISGITTVSSTGYMMIPAGPTEYRGGRGRGVFAGGNLSPAPRVNTIEYITIATTGNSNDFGDLTGAKNRGASCASATRGIFANGIVDPGSAVNTIDYITISATGNAFDFGDISSSRGDTADDNRFGITGCSNNTRGIFSGGYSPVISTSIDFINIASLGNSILFGELTQRRRDATSLSSPTRGIIIGGYNGPASQNIMDYVTISTTGNAIDFGDITNTVLSGSILTRHNAMPASSGTRGLFAGGSVNTNAIDYVTIASLGDSIDFGDLTETKAAGNGTSNSIRAVFAGGSTPTFSNVIDYVTIESTGNAADYGDLSSKRHYLFNGQCSDAHGGLG